MAGVIIGSISLALTLAVYAYWGLRRRRKPKFWVTNAQLALQPLAKDPTSNRRVVQDMVFSIAFIGGGAPRNIIDASIAWGNPAGIMASGSAGFLGQVVHIPAELADKFSLSIPGGLVIDADAPIDELPCTIRLDCGSEVFRIDLVLTGNSDVLGYFSMERFSRMLPERSPSRLVRAIRWLRQIAPRR